MEEDKRKKKLVLLSVASVVLVAMVVGLIAVTVNLQNEEKGENRSSGEVKTSVKAVCQNTDYKETCMESLANAGDATDPKDLIKIAFDATVKGLQNAIKNSTVLQEAYSDPRTREALKACEELADLAIKDLQKCFSKMDYFRIDQVGEALSQLKIWLSGAITYEETCLDGFEQTEGDAGEKMRKALKKSMELTSNGLAMITDISQALQSMNLPKMFNRRLLSDELSLPDDSLDHPDWVEDSELYDETKGRDLREKKKIKKIKPNMVVAKDGSGDFKTIGEALLAVPTKAKKRYVMYIKEGVYEENVKIFSNITHLMMIGDGPEKTRITGRLNWLEGTPTYHTATVAVSGDFFIARDIGFENSAGAEKHQAVALRVSADRAIFYNCHMDGYQDTLYAHTYRQFYRNCRISGTIDFIFGDGAAVFQNCTFVVRKPMDNQQCIVTAQGRKDIRQPTGLVLQNCSFVAAPDYFPLRKNLKSYLARPWKEFSRTVILESYIDDLIDPQGYLPWNETFALNTLFYTEFNNVGPGASKLRRAQWPGVKELPVTRLKRFTAEKFILGDLWIPQTGIPYTPGLMFPTPKDDSHHSYSKSSPEEKEDETPILKTEKHKKKHSKSKKSGSRKHKRHNKAAEIALAPESQIGAPAPSPAASPAEQPELIVDKNLLAKIFGII